MIKKSRKCFALFSRVLNPLFVRFSRRGKQPDTKIVRTVVRAALSTVSSSYIKEIIIGKRYYWQRSYPIELHFEGNNGISIRCNYEYADLLSPPLVKADYATTRNTRNFLYTTDALLNKIQICYHNEPFIYTSSGGIILEYSKPITHCYAPFKTRISFFTVPTLMVVLNKKVFVMARLALADTPLDDCIFP